MYLKYILATQIRGDYKGGNTALASNLSLYCPLPFNLTDELHARLRLYLQAANVIDVHSINRVDLNRIKNTMRYGAGVGIV